LSINNSHARSAARTSSPKETTLSSAATDADSGITVKALRRYDQEPAIKHTLTKSAPPLVKWRKTMKRAGSKLPVEQQPDEQPDDLRIPDFLRRPIQSSATPPVDTTQQSAFEP
jgi:hypothetical protein